MKKLGLAAIVICLLLVLYFSYIHDPAAEPQVGNEAAELISSEEPIVPTPSPIPPLIEAGYDDTVRAALLEKLSQSEVLSSDSPKLRKFPYPYKAMLTICSDCDNTTVEAFERVHRFLNTREETQFGKGLGLDVSDSFFVYHGTDYFQNDDVMTYCEGTDPDTLKSAALIKKYYDCGWIDSIHAFGDFSRSTGSLFQRALATRAWELLDAAGIAPAVWIDHGTYTNVQNFGSYGVSGSTSYQSGDDPASQFYHTDMTLSRNIRYVWFNRHSPVFGQDFPLSPRALRDGQTVWSFIRYSCELVGSEIDWTWRPNRLRDQLTAERLDTLEANGHYVIVGQHLTMADEEFQPGPEDIAALRMLAERHHESRTVMVSRTSRMLEYAVTQKYLTYQVSEHNGITGIRIVSVEDPVTGPRVPSREELSGVTFYCDNPQLTVIFIGDLQLEDNLVNKNPEDHTGVKSVSIPWFPEDVKDYSAT